MNYVEIYKDVLNFHRNHSNIKDSEEFWQGVINDSELIFEKYDKMKFVKDLLIAVLSELERKEKEARTVEQRVRS